MSLTTTVIPYLDDSPENFVTVLRSLHNANILKNSNNEELTVISKKAINYLLSKEEYLKYVGSELIFVIIENPIILTHFIKEFLTDLIRLLKNYNNIDEKVYNSVLKTTLKVCVTIKGKASLTREHLTPNLPIIVGTVINNLDFTHNSAETWEVSMVVLSRLIKNHSTIMRPFATSLENKIIGDKFGGLLKTSIDRSKTLKVLTLLNYVNKNPILQWSIGLNKIFEEFQSIFQLIFENIVEINEEFNVNKLIESLKISVNLENKNVNNISKISLPSLNIDFNESKSINEVYHHLKLLTELLISHITTFSNSNILNYPVGKLINLIEIFLNVSTSLHKYNSQLLIGDRYLKETLVVYNFKIQFLGLKVLNSLIKITKKVSLRYYQKFLNFFELIIPLNKKTSKVDYKLIKLFKFEFFEIFHYLTDYLNNLKTIELYDFATILKFIDISLILIENDNYNDIVEDVSKTFKSKTTKRKNKSSIELSDFITNPANLIILNDSSFEIKLIQFFEACVIQIPKLSITQYSKIQNYLIISLITDYYHRNTNNIKTKSNLLKKIVIYSNENEKFSVLPIVSNLLSLIGDEEFELSLLLNPRFPVINKRELEDFNKEDEIEDKIVEKKEDEQVSKEKIEELKIQIRNEVKQELQEEFKQLEVENEKLLKKRKLNGSSISIKQLENDPKIWAPIVVEEKVVVQQKETAKEEAPKEIIKDDDSDFEIPDIEVGSSDDDDDDVD